MRVFLLFTLEPSNVKGSKNQFSVTECNRGFWHMRVTDGAQYKLEVSRLTENIPLLRVDQPLALPFI